MGKAERYIIIEDRDPAFRAVEAIVDERAGEIIITRDGLVDDYKTLRRPLAAADKLIVSFPPGRATTVESVVSVRRTKTKEPINEGELDYLVFKGLWEFLNENRIWAAHKMRIADFDMILTNVEVSNVAVDGHNVVTPLGLEGTKVVFTIRGTFVPRSVLPIVESIRRAGHVVRIIEGMAVASAFIGDGVVVHGGRRRTYVYSSDARGVRFRHQRRWGTRSLELAVSSSLGISQSNAIVILERYLTGRVSNRFNGVIAERIGRQLRKFSRVVQEVSSAKDVVRVNVPQVLYKQMSVKAGKIYYADVQKLLADRGFRVIMETGQSHPLDDTTYLAYLGSALFSTHYGELNRILRRRARWLTHNS